MAGGTQVPVYVGRVAHGVVIRPEGACTIAICESVRQALSNLQQQATQDVDLDLSRADWIDSTFAGYLVSLVTRPRDHAFNLHLVSPSSGAAQSLLQMHVLSLFDVRDQLTEQPEVWELLPAVESDKASAAQCLLNAHECLIEADKRNEPVFAPVVRLFRGPGPPGPKKD